MPVDMIFFDVANIGNNIVSNKPISNNIISNSIVSNNAVTNGGGVSNDIVDDRGLGIADCG